jgi:hypothetical protein
MISAGPLPFLHNPLPMTLSSLRAAKRRGNLSLPIFGIAELSYCGVHELECNQVCIDNICCPIIFRKIITIDTLKDDSARLPRRFAARNDGNEDDRLMERKAKGQQKSSTNYLTYTALVIFGKDKLIH